MKLVYLTTTGFLDGDLPLIKALRKQGIDVYLFLTVSPYHKRSTLIDIKTVLPINDIIKASSYDEFKVFNDFVDLDKFYVINKTSDSFYSPTNLKLQLKLNKKIKEINPDVIHKIHIPEWSSFLPVLRKKMVVTIHDHIPHKGEKFFRKWLNYWTCMKMYKRFVLLNSNQAEEFKQHWGIDQSKIFVNRMGSFDCIKIFEDTNKEASNNKTVLFFGRVSPYKGIEVLLEAMKIVHKALPEVNLIVAGGGKYYFETKSYEDLPYIEIRNRFIGMTEMAQLIDNSSVVCCPYIEATQSGVVLTAFALDKPVIATNVGGMSNYISDGETGILLEPNNPSALAEAIISYFKSDDLQKSLVSNIKKAKSESDMNWDKIATRYIAFYNSIK